MFLEIPRRSWKRSNRVTPKNASLMMSIVHHSPTTSRVWATEQLIPWKLVLRMASPYQIQLRYRTYSG